MVNRQASWPWTASISTLRPEAPHTNAQQCVFEGTVRRVMFLGSVAEYVVQVEGLGELLIDHPNPVASELLAAGDHAWLSRADGVAAVL
ncbi:MAG: TOBE domain-containing protein [Burkholderiaceae bacterium]